MSEVMAVLQPIYKPSDRDKGKIRRLFGSTSPNKRFIYGRQYNNRTIEAADSVLGHFERIDIDSQGLAAALLFADQSREEIMAKKAKKSKVDNKKEKKMIVMRRLLAVDMDIASPIEPDEKYVLEAEIKSDKDGITEFVRPDIFDLF